MRAESAKAESTAKRSHFTRERESARGGARASCLLSKSAKGTSCYVALRFQTEKLILNDGKEDQSNRETLGCHPEQ